MNTLWPEPSLLEGATPHQAEQYALATHAPVGILGGNPGAGKTYLSGLIIRSLARQFGSASIALCAPTGKAAVRLTESVARHGVQLEAMTIHRLLGVQRNGHDGKGWGFMHNEACPLSKRFVFVDEASMLSTKLGADLLAACAPGTHVLFVGDFAQLPPVDHGAPLRDMIAAGLPYGELTEIHRNAGDIVRACLDLRENRPFRPSRPLNIPDGANLQHLEASRPTTALAMLGNLLRSVPGGVNAAWDIQVLCATNEPSDVSRKALNASLQNILNPGGQRIDGNVFRLGDKVICSSNDIYPVVECPDCQSTSLAWHEKHYVCGNCNTFVRPGIMVGDFVANGEIGRVSELHEKFIHVSFDSPRRTVRIAGETMQAFSLAYAITTHKAQGSQWPIVICMVDDSRGGDWTTSWEWWRTAFSRAEKLCITIGRKGAIDRQCRRSALQGRKTFLKELLTNN